MSFSILQIPALWHEYLNALKKYLMTSSDACEATVQ